METEGSRWHGPARYTEPGHLAAIGARKFLMTAFQDFLDKRMLQRGYDAAALSRSADDELIVDYVADTGDGFTATYSVFRLLNPDSMGHGDILVLGGDEVYPAPTAAAYQERLLGPMSDAVPSAYLIEVCALIDAGDLDQARAALQPCGDPTWHAHQVATLRAALRAEGRHDLDDTLFSDGSTTPAIAEAPSVDKPMLVAIPGNHDWYDGLTAFEREFMQPGREVGAYETAQHRSYWAIDVTVDGQRWWLWGIDMALDADVDHAQLEYFLNCGTVPGEPVVLFVAAPLWTYAEHRGEQIYRFEQAAIHARGLTLALVVAGDRHNYMRRESNLAAETGGRRADAPPRITAGLGGAFKHPPHLEKTVPKLWAAEPDRHGKPRRTLPYVAAELPGGVPFDRSQPRQAGSPPPEVSFPSERQSRRMVGLRHSFSAWWRWNRAFTMIPLIISFIAATTTLQTSSFWRQDADFSDTTFWQLGGFFLISFNLIVVMLLFGLAAAVSAPDPAARFQKTQRLTWTLLHGSALCGALWGSTWAAQQLARLWLDDVEFERTSERVWEGLAFLGLAGVLGALSLTTVAVLFLWVTNRAQMSVNALATWNLEQNYVGLVRLRFTRDAIIGEVHGVEDVKVENPEKIWKRVPDARGTQARVEPRWDREPLVAVDHFEIKRPVHPDASD